MARKNPPAAPSEALRLEYLPLEQLLRWPGNPKDHAEEAIAASIARFGFRDPLAIDERSGRLVAGHGRLTVLERAHAAGSPPPRFVQVAEDGSWLIPVTRGGAFDDEQEAGAYLLAHNRLGELGGWDDELLQQFAAPLPEDLLSVAGFDDLLQDLERGAQAAPTPEPVSEFLNDLIGTPPSPATPATPAQLEQAGQGATPAAPPVNADPDEQYFQIVYVVRRSDRDLVQAAIKRAKTQFGAQTAPDAFLAIVRAYSAAPVPA